MTSPELEAEALRLAPRERAQLARTLLTSLGDLAVENIREIWLDEAERRDEELESGSVRDVDGPAVFARIRSRYT